MSGIPTFSQWIGLGSSGAWSGRDRQRPQPEQLLLRQHESGPAARSENETPSVAAFGPMW